MPGGGDGDGLLVAEGLEPDVLELRADARALAAAEAKRLRRVVAIAERVTRETSAFLALGGRVPGAASDTELVMSAVTGELMMALGDQQGPRRERCSCWRPAWSGCCRRRWRCSSAAGWT